MTPLQMINAVSAIANGGLLYRPHVVLALRRGSQVEQEPQPEPKRVVRETTAATMRAMLEGVVLNGTGNQGAARWLHRRGQDRHGAENRSRHGPLFRHAADRLVCGLCSHQQSGGHDSRAARFARWASMKAARWPRRSSSESPSRCCLISTCRTMFPLRRRRLRAARRSQAESADVSDFDPAQFDAGQYGRLLIGRIGFGSARGFRRGCGTASGADGGAGRGRGRVGARPEREDGSPGDGDLRAAGRKSGAGRRGNGAVAAARAGNDGAPPALR